MESTKVSFEKWGQYGHLIPSQEEALRQFKAAVPIEHVLLSKYSVETEEQVCLRYLRARQFDVSRALTLIMESYQVKNSGKAKQYAKMKVDETMNCDISVLRTFYPHAQRGYDKCHRPILFEREGKCNVNAMFLLLGDEALYGYHYWTMERVLDKMFNEAAVKFNGAPSSKTLKQMAAPGSDPTFKDLTVSLTSPVTISTCAVLDMNDVTMSQAYKIMDIVKLLIALDNVAYPEMLGKMLIINAPWFGVQIWTMIRSWLDPRTQQKIEIVPQAESIKRLHELIDIEYLPPEYGGTAPDLYYSKPDTAFIQLGGGEESTVSITVPVGKALFLDTYVGDGAVEITVSSTLVSSEPFSSNNSAIGLSTPSSSPMKSFSSSMLFNSNRKSSISGSTASMAMDSDDTSRKDNSYSIIHEIYQFTGSTGSGEGKRGCKRLLKKFVSTFSGSKDGKHDSMSSIGTADSTITDMNSSGSKGLPEESHPSSLNDAARIFTIKLKNMQRDYFSNKKLDLIYSLTVVDGGESAEFPDMMKVVKKHTAIKKPKMASESKGKKEKKEKNKDKPKTKLKKSRSSASEYSEYTGASESQGSLQVDPNDDPYDGSVIDDDARTVTSISSPASLASRTRSFRRKRSDTGLSLYPPDYVMSYRLLVELFGPGRPALPPLRHYDIPIHSNRMSPNTRSVVSVESALTVHYGVKISDSYRDEEDDQDEDEDRPESESLYQFNNVLAGFNGMFCNIFEGY